jgi:hypothetical protein
MDVSVDIATVTVRYRATGAGFGRLAYTYFPYLDVRLDGNKTPFFCSAMHNIVVPLPQGEHVISIHGRVAPLQRWAFYGSVLAAGGAVLFPARALAAFNYERDKRGT